MSNYLIDIMTWSYSRINAYLQCPYQFYLKYINHSDETPMFFANYGSLVHSILSDYYMGQRSKQDSLDCFLIRFPTEAVGAYPSKSIRMSYFQQGIDCMKGLSPIGGKVLSTEELVNFCIGSKRFLGFIDLVYEDDDGALCVMDHKSRSLKPRSRRKKQTKTDVELDEYLRQLYLYSIAINSKYGRFPDFLGFNCYRSGTRIKEPFQIDALEETKDWAIEVIDRIGAETFWSPNLDFWRCKYLCNYCHDCEYAQIASF